MPTLTVIEGGLSDVGETDPIAPSEPAREYLELIKRSAYKISDIGFRACTLSAHMIEIRNAKRRITDGVKPQLDLSLIDLLFVERTVSMMICECESAARASIDRL